MSAIRQAQENQRNAAKAATLDKMQSDMSMQQAYDAGNASAQNAIQQALAERAAQQMDANMERGYSAFYNTPQTPVDQGPSLWDQAINKIRGWVDISPEEYAASTRSAEGAQLQRDIQDNLVQSAFLNAKAEGDSSEANINRHMDLLRGGH